MSPARSISWWLTTSASAGVSFTVLIGYCERRIALDYGVTEPKTTSWHLSRTPLIRCPPIGYRDGHRAPSPAAQPGDLPAAEPADDRVPLLGLLRRGGGDRQALRAGRHGRVRGDDLRHPRRAHRAPHAHRELLRQGVRQSRRHGGFRPRAGDRRLPVGRRAHHGIRWLLGAFWLARLLLLCGRGGPAPGALQRPGGDRRQALFRGTAEPVRRGDRRRFRLVLQRVA